MCSRFELDAPLEEIAARFGITVPPGWQPPGLRRPTDTCLLVGPEGGMLRPWGMAVDWDRKPLINARAESLTTRSTFRPLLNQPGSRILVPATRWYEWRKEGNARHRNLIRALGGVFAFAGLLRADGFVIVTCPPTSRLAAIHNRMPVVLTPEGAADWLDSGLSFPQVAGHLRPYEGELEAVEDRPAQPSLF
ncbi:SOS response-associated peptidase [Telmatospirillum sp. J64-1]|uniref:SOS response-associated peptidase n=1 Tax=Telmatospirillum sp. J64-1 TaxID=2502183 RepID=UPI00115D0977|nr:SOS response-associated peptidase family protein [Telmatospirillum sp. J64-1]